MNDFWHGEGWRIVFALVGITLFAAGLNQAIGGDWGEAIAKWGQALPVIAAITLSRQIDVLTGRTRR